MDDLGTLRCRTEKGTTFKALLPATEDESLRAAGAAPQKTFLAAVSSSWVRRRCAGEQGHGITCWCQAICRILLLLLVHQTIR